MTLPLPEQGHATLRGSLISRRGAVLWEGEVEAWSFQVRRLPGLPVPDGDDEIAHLQRAVRAAIAKLVLALAEATSERGTTDPVASEPEGELHR
jgi:hypothetical protein